MRKSAFAHKRVRIVVDPAVQGGLLWGATRYWLFSLATVGLLTMIGWTFTTPGMPEIVASTGALTSSSKCLLVALGVGTLLLPVVLLDLAKFTNRFAGPMCRLRTAMDKLAEGEQPGPLRFRKGDFWHDAAESFNRIASRLDDSRRRLEEAERRLEALENAHRPQRVGTTAAL
jgi:hypothetical protein